MLKKEVKRFWVEEEGSGTVETILILVVALLFPKCFTP